MKKKKKLKPAAKAALEQFKYEIADEINHSKKKSPTIGDYMVQQMIKSQEDKMNP